MNAILIKSLIVCVTIGFNSAVFAETEHEPLVQEPEVPTELAAEGVVYHTLTGREAQVTFTSKAPLENIVGKSNAVVGYVVSGSEASPAELVGAQWLLPVKSLATGIPLRDKHIADHKWLNAKSHPAIRFLLTSTEDVTLIKSGDGFSTWSLTLVGDMTMRGVTHTIRVEEAKLSFLEASEKTLKIAKGDLCFLKCVYKVWLSDFDIHHKDVPNKVSDEIKLNQMLRMSTVKQ